MTEGNSDLDIQAMLRLAKGDDLALNGIMDRWKQKLAAFFYRSTANHDVSIDLTQETFVKLYQSRQRYKASASFATYLFSIAANLARNHARGISRHPTVSLDDEAQHQDRCVQDKNPSPDESAHINDEMHQVQTALASLPLELREALLLFTYEEMSHREIAGILGCSVKAVETRIYRARQALRETLPHLCD